jgi:hypothetical protein
LSTVWPTLDGPTGAAATCPIDPNAAAVSATTPVVNPVNDFIDAPFGVLGARTITCEGKCKRSTFALRPAIGH